MAPRRKRPQGKAGCLSGVECVRCCVSGGWPLPCLLWLLAFAKGQTLGGPMLSLQILGQLQTDQVPDSLLVAKSAHTKGGTMGSAAPPSHARWTTLTTTHDTPSLLPPPAAHKRTELQPALCGGASAGALAQKNYLRKAGGSHSRTDVPRKRGVLRLHAGNDAHQPSATNTLL
jgi:hypothetical protein